MSVIETIIKKYGRESIISGGGQSQSMIPVIPTGSLAIDVALGVGGIPRGRITEVSGHYAGGKTTLCQHLTAETQRMGGQVAYLDVENALDDLWMRTCGIDLDKLILCQPDSAEQAMDIAKLLIQSKEIDLVVVDSVAALLPRAEIEGELGDSHISLIARLMSQTMRLFAPIVKESGTAVVFTNQMRQRIGGYGPSETTTGGEALKYYASVRILMSKGEDIKKGSDIVGSVVKARVIKSKVSPPFKTAEIEIRFDTGFDQLSELVRMGSELNLVEKAGSGWYTIEGQKVQGMDQAKQILKENPELPLVLENRIRQHYGLPLKRMNNA